MVLLLVAGAPLGGFDTGDDGLHQIGGLRLAGVGVLRDDLDCCVLVLAGGVTQLASRGHDSCGFCAALVVAVRPEDECVIAGRDNALPSIDRVRVDPCVTILGDDAFQVLHVFSFLQYGQ